MALVVYPANYVVAPTSFLSYTSFTLITVDKTKWGNTEESDITQL
jgi:hypothetical protein